MRGTLTGQRYVDDILRPHVGPFLNGLPGEIFQHDNARPHTERVAQDFLRHFQTLPWPSCSPDLSPKIRAGLDCPTISLEEFVAVEDEYVCTTPVMVEKDILEFVQSSKNFIHADSDGENELNNAASLSLSVLKLAEMKIIKGSSKLANFIHQSFTVNFSISGIIKLPKRASVDWSGMSELNPNFRLNILGDLTPEDEIQRDVTECSVGFNVEFKMTSKDKYDRKAFL
ncbi:DDE_3 domain-containing protein [Trichonephila clavipes]|nr:DDE_3 domain-containing protein [Trichonephila clavipes]